MVHTALNPQAPSLIGLGEFLQSRDFTILTATLRGFAGIGAVLKDPGLNLDPSYRHHLEHIRWKLTANLDLNHDEDPSVQLFKRLCHEAESGGSDMIRWAAAYALEQLDYPASLRRQLLHRPPAEITAEILSRFMSRLSGQENPCSNPDYIKFWVYGPTEILFSQCSGTYYQAIVQQVLLRSGIRGIRLALQGGNRLTIIEAINFAGQLFNQIASGSQDKGYIDPATRQKLASLLLPLLNHSALELRNIVAEKLNDRNNNYHVSNHILEPSDRAIVAIIDADWKRVVSLGDVVVPVLCKAVEGNLRLEINENANINCQIGAIRTIDEILKDIPQKARILTPYLQHGKDTLREEVARLLQPQQNHLDAESAQILTALLFQLDLPHESNIDSLYRESVDNCLRMVESHKRTVQETFAKAISACASSSVLTKDFLTKQQNIFLERIEQYSNNLQRIERCRRLAEDEQVTEQELKNIQGSIEEGNKQRGQYFEECRSLRVWLENSYSQGLSFNGLIVGIFILPFLLVFLGIGGASFIYCIIIYYLGLILSRESKRKLKSRLKSRLEESITNSFKQSDVLENKKNELKKQLDSIQSKIKENKCD